MVTVSGNPNPTNPTNPTTKYLNSTQLSFIKRLTNPTIKQLRHK